MNFIDQLKNLKEQVKFKADLNIKSSFSNIIISGMGGSGIAGRIFSEIYSEKPVRVVSDYIIPEYADSNTLFVGISYSGNTEETISATKQALKKGCQIRLITSGGALAEMSDDVVIIPSGLQPRSALGYLLKPFLYSFMNNREDDYAKISSQLGEMDSDNSAQNAFAEELFLKRQIPVILSHYPYNAIGYRWKTQFNENSKLLAYSSEFPELDHNEIVPMKDSYNRETFRFITFGDAPERIAKRMEITSRITGTSFSRIEPIGKSLIEKLFYLIHYGDYVSFHLANYRKVDPEDVSTLTELKHSLLQ